MKVKYFFAALLLLFIQCEDKIDVDYGDCKFAPANSKFSTFPPYCEECFMQIQFMGQEYTFKDYQIDRFGGHSFYPEKNWISVTLNDFFGLDIISPNSVEILKKSVGLKTPLLKHDSIIIDKLNLLPPVSVSFGIRNMCGKWYEPMTRQDISQSNHTLSSVKFLSSDRYLADSGPYLRSYFLCTGDLRTNFVLDDKIQPMTGNYKLTVIIYEKE